MWLNGTQAVDLDFNAANQVVGWSYDAAGNLLSDGSTTSSYDALSRLTSQGGASYAYNGDGALVGQTSSATTVAYVQDLAAPLAQVLGDGTASYLYGAERLGTLGATPTWYVGDALGSLRLTLDAAGTPLGSASYDPWGTPETGLIAPFGFTGELQDAAGLVHLRARWYNPATATLLSRDPFAGFAEQPYSLNPYQYAYANPVLLTDPSGQTPLLAGAAALIVVGGVIVSLGQAGALAPISPEAQRLYDDAAEGLEDVIGGAADAAVSTGLRSLFTLGNWAWEQEGFSLDPSLSGWGAMVFVLGGVSCYLRTDQFAFDTPSISDLFVAGPMLVELWHYLTTATPWETLPPDNTHPSSEEPEGPEGIRVPGIRFWNSRGIDPHEVKYDYLGGNARIALFDLAIDDRSEHVWIIRKGASASTAIYVGTLKYVESAYGIEEE